MRKIRSIAWVFTTAGLFLPASIAHSQFSQLQFDSTSGRVGYHMVVNSVRVFMRDLPRGNSGGGMTGTCGFQWGDLAYEGGLPPGVVFDSGGIQGIFSGTPRQPGIWRGTLWLNAHCAGGPDTNIYRRSISITFTIEP